jgi:uncharacterized protein YdgA (DUF945 family)
MKLAVALVAGALAIIIGLAPYGFGARTEQTLTALVQLAADVWDIPIFTTRYTRGWFDSTAETFLVLPLDVVGALRPYLPHPSTSAAPPEGLSMAHHIRHGPFPLAARPDGVLSLLPVQTMITSSLAPGVLGSSSRGASAAALPSLQVYTTVFLHGAGQSHVVIPAFAYPPGDPTAARFVWAGLHGDVTVGASGEHAASSLQTPGLKFIGADSVVALHDVVTRTEVLTRHRQPSRSDTLVRVGAIEVTNRTENQCTWAITGGEVRATTTVTGETLQGVTDVQLDTLRLADVPHGPGTLHLELRQLPMAALTRVFYEIIAQWQDEQDVATLWIRLWFSEELARRLAEVARTQPEIALTQMRLQTADGEIHASLQVRLDGNRVLAPAYLPQLLQTIDARAVAEAPASWVRAMVTAQVSRVMRARYPMATLLPASALKRFAATVSDRYLQSLVEQEYVILDGNTYKSQARYLHGQLLVNGKPLHLYDPAP